MTDKKFTDEDIISSLEVIATTGNCDECKIRNCKWGTCNCSQITANAALELINRQKSEIERYKRYYYRHEYDKWEKQIKVEAYKEFVEKLCDGKVSNDKTVIEAKVLLKEMVGD